MNLFTKLPTRLFSSSRWISGLLGIYLLVVVVGCSLNFSGDSAPEVPIIQPPVIRDVVTATSTSQTAMAEGVAPKHPPTGTPTDFVPPTSTALSAPLQSTSTGTPTRTPRPTTAPVEIGRAMATVVISSLALRRVPLEDGPIIGAVRQGEEYPVSALSRDGKWVRLDTPISVGGRGWVVAHNVSVWGEITGIEITDGFEPENPPGALTADQAVVITGDRRLRLRTDPNEAAETVFFAFNGELFTILERTPDDQWIHIFNTQLGAEGWALRRFMRLAEDPIPTPRPTPTSTPTTLLTPRFIPSATPLPSSSTPTPPVEMSATNSATATETDTKQDIATGTPTNRSIGTPLTPSSATATPTPPLVGTATRDSQEANAGEPTPLVSTRTVSPSTTLTVWPTAPTGNVIVVTNGGRLRVRSQPTEDAEVITHVFNGELYPLLETSADGGWVRIAIDGFDEGGWVADRFVITPSE